MITVERLKVEAKIIKRMLWRIGLKVTLEVLTWPELWRKIFIPMMDKPIEEYEWDIGFSRIGDFFGHTGAFFLVWETDRSDCRCIEYDPVYEKMWEDMARTVDRNAQEEKIRQMVQHAYDRVHWLFIYSPLTLYAVNKAVNFVPQKNEYLRLKETSVTDNHWSVRGEKK